MPCYTDYISISQAYRPSRSGLYADQLPGMSRDLIDNLARDPEDDADSIWPILVKRGWDNMVSDISINLQAKFNVDKKLVSRETSVYKADENQNSGTAGIKIQFTLPKYAKMHIVKLQVFSEIDYTTPGITFKFYDTDETGELLLTITESINVGRSMINVDTDFEVDQVFVTYQTAQADFKQTENKHFLSDIWDSIVCDICLDPYGFYRGSVTQVNGGGINVFYNIRCSIEKFVCENINLFRQAYLYKLGQEITVERRDGERLTRYTTMTVERATTLKEDYDAQYNQNLSNAIKSMNIEEDPICFQCKNTVYVATSLP